MLDSKLERFLGDKTAKAFAKHLDIHTAGQLLEHYPRRYLSRGELTPLDQLPVGEIVTVVGEVLSANVRHLKGRSGSVFEVVISDGKERVSLAFFNQAWRQKELHPGLRGLFSGKIGSFSGKLQLAHPDYELFEDFDQSQAKAWAELPIPIYPASSTLTTWKIQKSVAIVLDSIGVLPEQVPEEVLEKEGLFGYDAAIRKIHQPQTQDEWRAARDSLRYQEALLLQLNLSLRRASLANQVSVRREPGERARSFEKALPFDLTAGQLAVIAEIDEDLASGRPMHRLLQGEVGSGKTVVALRAMLAAADSKGQSALLAPTEVLAAQHYRGIRSMLGEELSKQVGLVLLTGQMPASEQKKVLLDIASGKSLIAVGTHSLISTRVEFADLALVVIDEQHRFGVKQREALKAKAKFAPHLLTMTATPIPRTMAITVFGDLDVSTLKELPAGRQEIETFVVPVSNSGLVSRVWQRVSEEVAAGRQAFVVCPRISGELIEEDSNLEIDDATQLAAAEEVFDALGSNPSLAGLRIGLLHGRLDKDQKDNVMQAFAAGEIDVLVATTVIEVGVNVPNATAIVLLDADRFGVSQLHQLRGRVGRGQYKGVCLMLTAADRGSVAMQRLEAVASTTDGFRLSELDLEIRGEGDVLGETQAGGRSGLKLLRVIADAALIERTRTLANTMLEQGLDESLVRLLQTRDAQALTRS